MVFKSSQHTYIKYKYTNFDEENKGEEQHIHAFTAEKR